MWQPTPTWKSDVAKSKRRKRTLIQTAASLTSLSASLALRNIGDVVPCMRSSTWSPVGRPFPRDGNRFLPLTKPSEKEQTYFQKLELWRSHVQLRSALRNVVSLQLLHVACAFSTLHMAGDHLSPVQKNLCTDSEPIYTSTLQRNPKQHFSCVCMCSSWKSF